MPPSLRRAPRRRRALGAAVAVAGVLGAIGGSLTAASLGDRPGGSATDRADVRPGTDPRPGQVLWADRDALHDGDVVVPLRLVDPPASVQRVAGGWVVTSVLEGPGATTGLQADVVRPDGSTTFLAEIADVGDVSPGGEHYVAATEEGYLVWDLTTREVVDRVVGGRRAGQEATGRAQYVDGDTLVTGWSDADGNRPELLVGDLGSGQRQVVADDVAGPWGISPDGRWLVARMVMVMRDGVPTGGCTLVRALDGSTDDVEDCGGEVADDPSFLPDSSAVLVTAGDPDSSLRYRALPLGGGPEGAVISAPYGARKAVVLDQERVAVVEGSTGRTVVYVCSAEAACEEVGSTRAGAGGVALGS